MGADVPIQSTDEESEARVVNDLPGGGAEQTCPAEISKGGKRQDIDS